jgi:hypothetical protein
MSPQTVVRGQGGCSPIVVATFIVGVVEVVFRFDHVVRISKQAALGASGTPLRGRHLDVGHVR